MPGHWKHGYIPLDAAAEASKRGESGGSKRVAGDNRTAA